MSLICARKLFIFCALVAVLGVQSACTFIEKIRPSASKNTFGGLTGSVERQTFVKKFNTYMECANNVNRSVQNAYENYVNSVSGQPAITGKGGRASSYWSAPTFTYINDTDQKRVKDLELALDDSPAIEGLDAAGREYVGAFNQLMTLTNEARTYYGQNNYKDDNFVKGREMNGPLMTAYEGFVKASQRMGDELDKQEDALRQKELAELDKKGTRDADYHMINLYIQSKNLLKVTTQPEITLAQFTPAYEAYEKTYQDARAYVDKNPSKETSPGMNYGKLDGIVKKASFMMPSMDGARADSPAEMLLIQAKEMGRYLNKGQKPPKSGLGSPTNIGNSYDNLISALNAAAKRS